MRKIEEFLEKVYSINKYYKNIVDAKKLNLLDITQYPILTRKQLQENRYKMFSDSYKSKYYNKELRKQSSSGSSGIPVHVYWDYKDFHVSIMSLWRKRFEYYGILASDRYVLFTLNAFDTEKNSNDIYYVINPNNLLNINISLIHKNDDYQKLINIIDNFKPTWFYIPPFVLNKLIHVYKQSGLNPPKSLKYIESVGELLSSELKQKAIDFFKVPVSNMYGSEEMNGIAYECPYHHMHVLSDNVYVECKNGDIIKNYGTGEAIITNLNNYSMPLIRYNQGDQIVLINPKKPCLCGTISPEIEFIKGRTLDIIEINKDIELNPYMLLEVIAEVNNHFNSIITNYRFIYRKLNKKLECLIYIEEKDILWYSNVEKFIKKVFWSKIDYNYEFEFEVREIEKINTYNSKFKIFEVIE